MKQKDLKIDFRYLTGNIACLSVDSISGESVHNDINNEEAIIIFNSLVGEKADCQTVKSLLEEIQKLKEQVEDKILLEMKLENELFNKRKEYQETYKDVRIEIKEYKTQQKEFIKYLEDEKDRLIKETSHYYIDSFDRQHSVNKTIYDEVDMILQKYKEIIGVSNEKK